MTISSKQVQQLVKIIKAAERLLRELEEEKRLPRARKPIKPRRCKIEAKELKRLIAIELTQGLTASDIAKTHAVSRAYIYSIRKRLLRDKILRGYSHTTERECFVTSQSRRTGELDSKTTTDPHLAY